MFDVRPIYDYIRVLKENAKSDLGAYKEKVKTAEISFRSSITQVALEMEDEKRLILFIRDFEDLAKAFNHINPITQEEYTQAERIAYKVMKANEAAEYIRRVQKDLSKDLQVNDTLSGKKKQEPVELCKFEKKLQNYGELLSVKDLTEIFCCTPRTITNWEEKGLIVNIAETSDEINVMGRRKRGQEKRYRKDSILRSIALRERFESQV